MPVYGLPRVGRIAGEFPGRWETEVSNEDVVVVVPESDPAGVGDAHVGEAEGAVAGDVDRKVESMYGREKFDATLINRKFESVRGDLT